MPSSPHTWIDPQDHDQLTWLMKYLGRHQPDFTVPVAPYTLSPLPDASALIAALEARMADPLFLDRYRKMQNAWRQKKSRQRPDKKSVTYKLPNQVLDLLDKLARKRGTTKVDALGEVIRDAWHEHDRGAKQLKKTKATYKSRLKDQSTKHQQAQQISRQAIEALLKALSLELHQRCRLEALVGKDDGLPLEGTSIDDYSALVSKRVMELEVALQDMHPARLSSATLRARMQALAERDGLERTTDDMQ